MNDWNKMIGQRLICTEAITRIPRHEWTVLEVAPSGRYVKLRNETCDAVFWRDTDGIVVLEVLTPSGKEDK